MKDRTDRYDNIKIMEQKLNNPIQIFFGINGTDIKETNLLNFDKNLTITKEFKLHGQLGCYLSHFLLLKEIYSNNLNYDYTVIFEDDFEITVNDLGEKINEAINKIDIDIDFLFLGTQSYCVGKKYKDNLYYINKKIKTWGFHGYVVKNKNINRILHKLYKIIYEVDIQLFKIIKNELLVGLFIYPNYVKQNKDISSIIRPKIISPTKNTINYIKPLTKNNYIKSLTKNKLKV
jgi:GR25 family glycosyltransferase involved in LPS biosynthesis